MIRILASVGDTHTNSTLGLCPPYVELEDGGGYIPSAFQLQMWDMWLDYVGTVSELSLLYDAPVYTALNGDICDGNHHDSFQLITRNPSTMQKIARRALLPLVDISDAVYVIRGTEAHSGGSGSLEEEFARDIGAIRSAKGVFTWPKLLLNVGGTIIDIAHHTSMGRLPWTSKNAANKLASLVLFEYANRGQKVPHLALRSHNHRYADSFTHYRVRGICMPAWQGKTEYVNRIDANSVPDIGGLIILCDDEKPGEPEVIVKRYDFPHEPPKEVGVDEYESV